MKNLSALIEEVIQDHDITPDAVPMLDLYMDQVLTLFNEGLAENKRYPQDKLLTKTMINNYSKEKLLLPVKGKKIHKAAHHSNALHLSSQANPLPLRCQGADWAQRCGF